MPVNVRNKAQELRIWTRSLAQLENILFREVSREIMRAFRMGAKGNEALGVEDLRVRLIPILERHYRRASRVFGGRVIESFPEKRSFGGLELKLSIPEFIDTLTAYIAERALFASETISRNVRERIIAAIIGATRDGLGEEETARRIIRTGAVESVSRARTIARTESHTAAIEAQREAVLGLGIQITTHEWITAGDERVRSSHADANGQQVPIDQPFEIGGFQIPKPGDSSLGAPAGEVINCRCLELFNT